MAKEEIKVSILNCDAGKKDTRLFCLYRGDDTGREAILQVRDHTDHIAGTIVLDKAGRDQLVDFLEYHSKDKPASEDDE